MIKTVVRQYGWTPHEASRLYIDGHDYFGLLYWYNDAKEVNDSLKNKKK